MSDHFRTLCIKRLTQICYSFVCVLSLSLLLLFLLSLFKEVSRAYHSLNDSTAELLELLNQLKEELVLLLDMGKRVVVEANQVAYVGEYGFTLGSMQKIICFVAPLLVTCSVCKIFQIMYARSPVAGKFVLVYGKIDCFSCQNEN